MRTETIDSVIWGNIPGDQLVQMSSDHIQSRLHKAEKGLPALIDHDQILFRYCVANSNVFEKTNVNGSIESKAGICNIEPVVVSRKMLLQFAQAYRFDRY